MSQFAIWRIIIDESVSLHDPQTLFINHNSSYDELWHKIVSFFFCGISIALNDTGVNWMWWAWWLIFSWVVGSYLWFLCQNSYYHFFSVWASEPFYLDWLHCFSIFLLSDYWWVVFSALNFQYWLVFLSSSSLDHYSHSTSCLLYNFSKVQPSPKALSTQKKWPRIFSFHWLTTRKMLRSSKMAQYCTTIHESFGLIL